ncbi:ArsR family transcriptional regulator [Roseospira navarrensis]|uniref:Uncharacterized protein n=1 Tax=Roseospira navarrensis TaxID=140058 RepID=A0A7X2D4C7_9PROT|nr:ArsR family transcriptional regulator [Roseospira navarrensis]MQX38289.1 hypothetical protein [Roseospira navarrensis]
MFHAVSAPVAAPAPAPKVSADLPMQARLLFDRLLRAAGTGAPCPSNFALMDALDLASPDGVRKHMEVLRRAGLIAVESDGQRRRVTILETGARTDWSRAGGHARAGAAYSDGWGNGSDAILVRLAEEGLDLATIATRLGRTPSSVRHRLRRLKAAGRVAEASVGEASAPAARPPAAPVRRREPGPMRRDLVTNDPDRPEHERDQIAAFLAAGKGRKVPPAYAGEVRGGTPLTGQAPISPLARRVLLALDDTPRPAAELAFRAGLDPLLMPETLHELGRADLATRHAGRGPRAPGGAAPARFTQGPEAGAAILAMGLETARARLGAASTAPVHA